MNIQSSFGGYASSNELDLLPANRTSYATHPAVAKPTQQGLLASIAAFFQRRAARREMEGLSDRELSDMGLSRNDLDRVFTADPDPR